uniref:NADH dehydrogenase subunit 6 n=1 Tax=Strongyloides ratti TaxID=34506 RepID=A0A0S3M469_STRRB|nr:NADH dehydrogenase subunit 6 [Strongyloides ratti]BAT21196.1 NADH dehydrogenase subunit 6 [Strongyloides ratti]
MFVFFFLFFSVLFCYFSFLSMDPMKSVFFLVISLVFLVVLISFGGYVWFSYFICMIFLSGVFVIIVYFSSLSNFFYFDTSFSFLVFFFSFFYFSFFYFYGYCFVSLNVFYYFFFFPFFFWIVFCLLFFMNFISFFIGFSGALRSF